MGLLPDSKLVHDYLSDRERRKRVNNSYSKCFKILFGILQGSILDPLLLNVLLAHQFLILNEIDIVNYADDNTSYDNTL